jgi:hypothetical protein
VRAFFRGGAAARVDPFVGESHQKVSVQNSLLRRYAEGAEVLPEEFFELAAQELCRFKRMRDCASFVARWSVEHPDSDRWSAALSGLRKGTRARTPALGPHLLEKLHAFYGGRFIPGEDAAPPHVEARRATDFYLNYYNHIVPFDRRAINDVWDRCDGEECDAERARAAELLWGLDGSTAR